MKAYLMQMFNDSTTEKVVITETLDLDTALKIYLRNICNISDDNIFQENPIQKTYSKDDLSIGVFTFRNYVGKYRIVDVLGVVKTN